VYIPRVVGIPGVVEGRLYPGLSLFYLRFRVERPVRYPIFLFFHARMRRGFTHGMHTAHNTLTLLVRNRPSAQGVLSFLSPGLLPDTARSTSVVHRARTGYSGVQGVPGAIQGGREAGWCIPTMVGWEGVPGYLPPFLPPGYTSRDIKDSSKAHRASFSQECQEC